MPAVVFRTGQRVRASGVYRVSHARHHLPREVTLLRGQVFPRCAECRVPVLFTQGRIIKELKERRGKIILNAIPVIKAEPTPAHAPAAAAPRNSPRTRSARAT